MTSVVERPGAARSARAELRRPRKPTGSLSPESAHAARVQHALSTSDRVRLGSITAASQVQGLHGAGGDLVDLIEVDGKLVAVLGDVSGKGAPASLVAAVVLSSVQHHVAHLGAHAGSLLAAVDGSVRDMLDRAGALVTLAIVVIDPSTAQMRLASAGHHPLVLATAHDVRRLRPTCPPLGSMRASTGEQGLDFAAGSALLIASDGITEQTDPAGREFGLDGLADVVATTRHHPVADAVVRVLEVVDRHARFAERSDDRAVIVIHAGRDR